MSRYAYLKFLGSLYLESIAHIQVMHEIPPFPGDSHILHVYIVYSILYIHDMYRIVCIIKLTIIRTELIYKCTIYKRPIPIQEL